MGLNSKPLRLDGPDAPLEAASSKGAVDAKVTAGKGDEATSKQTKPKSEAAGNKDAKVKQEPGRPGSGSISGKAETKPKPAVAPAPKMAKESFNIFRDLLDPIGNKPKPKKQETAATSKRNAEAEEVRTDRMGEDRPPPEYEMQNPYPEVAMLPFDENGVLIEDGFGQHETDFVPKREGENNVFPEGPAKRARLDLAQDNSGRPLVGILRKGSRKGLRVKWPPDTHLKAVRYFEPDESEINHERQFKSARDMDVAEAGHYRELKRNEMQPADIDWPMYLPREWLVNACAAYVQTI